MTALARLIVEEAEAAAAAPWAEAVACAVEGHPCPEGWAAVGRVLERAWMLLGLAGRARAWRSAGGPPPEPDLHARTEMLAEIEPGPFLEAIRQFQGRVPRLRETVQALIREAQAMSQAIIEEQAQGAAEAILARSAIAKWINAGSFFVTGVDKRTIVDLRKLLAEAVRGGDVGAAGLDLVPFIERAQLAGAAGLTRARLETVWRTNLSSAFNEGQMSVFEERPNVRELMPLLRLSEIKDRRTRGNPNGLYPDQGFHWQMDGFVGTPDDFRRYALVPPGGYNCRAGIRGVPVAEAQALGWINGGVNREALAAHNGDRIAILERGDYPDPGFLRS